MDPAVFVYLTLICINIIKTCDLRQLCTLNFNYVVIPHCSINVSSISDNTHVEYSRLFQYRCYSFYPLHLDSDYHFRSLTLSASEL